MAMLMTRQFLVECWWRWHNRTDWKEDRNKGKKNLEKTMLFFLGYWFGGGMMVSKILCHRNKKLSRGSDELAENGDGGVKWMVIRISKDYDTQTSYTLFLFLLIFQRFLKRNEGLWTELNSEYAWLCVSVYNWGIPKENLFELTYRK